MKRKLLPNQKKNYKELQKRLNGYTRKIIPIFSTLALEASKIAVSVDYDTEGMFRFSDFPKTGKKVNKLFNYFFGNIQALIYSGISEEWKNSNEIQDLLARRVLKSFTRQIGEKKEKAYFEANNAAKEAFKKRSINGLNLSQRLWNQREDIQRSLEYAISTGIEKGMSAVKLSKRVSKYLNDYPSLAKDYKKKYGKAIDISSCEYRSVRLTRNEINMAYRTAEQERWSKLDFISGYEIKTSGNHPKTDMCDQLSGKYNVKIKWFGWHVNCMCFAIPIVMSEEEYWSGKQTPQSVPNSFVEWTKKEKGKKGSYIVRYAENIRREKPAEIIVPQVKKEKSKMKDFINEVVNTKFKEVKLPTGETAKRLYITNEGKEYVVGKTFLTETMSKNIRNKELVETMKIASEVNEWFPKATFDRTEEGKHHNFKFKVFYATFNNKKIECKVKLTKENILYTMRIVK